MAGIPSLFHRPLRVALLGGGPSAERAVSLESAASVERALRDVGHLVTAIDPAEIDPLTVAWGEFDVAFLALHGTYGEDGTVQRLLADAGVPFTGSSAEASERAFSKSIAKERFRTLGVPTPGFAVVSESDHASRIRAAAEAVGYPLVVKPDQQGSSLGIGLVHEPEELSRALVRAFGYGGSCLLESYVSGSEWTVSVIDDLVLPLVRIETPRAFYDYEAKYESHETLYTVNAPIPDSVRSALREAGLAACQALGTSGLARADLRLDARNQPWVLEVNTLPGLTDHSLVPKAAAALGISFENLCERAIACALSGRLVSIPPAEPHRANAA